MLFFLIVPNVLANITFTLLSDVSIFAENIGSAKLYHTTCQVYISIDVSELELQLLQLHELYKDISSMF